ncbi:MAG TPA: LCP family protein [Acidimicrobiales bacterium]|jgi:hypothetical protein|nr:LCP family protein [Acidimicrobiales bacterium]
MPAPSLVRSPVSSSLPPSPPPVRRAVRRRERRRRRWQLVGTVFVVLVVVVAVIAALVHAVDGEDPSAAPGASSTRARSDEGAAVPAATGPHTALIVQAGSDGNAASLTVLATGPHTHELLLVPPGTMTELPSFGLEAVGSALSLGGPALLQATVENLLGVTLDDLVVVDDGRLRDLVANAGDLTVDLPQPVGTTWDAGRNAIAPSDVGTLWAAPAQTNDLARLARHQAFWEAWLSKLARDRHALPGGSLRPYLDALRRSSVSIDLLPVEALDAGAGSELYKVRDDDLEALVKSSLPDAVARGAAGRPRVQVLNGTGAVGVAQAVTLRLVQPPVRARVAYTGNADSFGHDETQVVFYDRKDQAVAERVRDALGVGRVVLSRVPLGIVDITVVVGRDFEPPTKDQPSGA